MFVSYLCVATVVARNQIGSIEIINIIYNNTLQSNNAYNGRECVQDKQLQLALHCCEPVAWQQHHTDRSHGSLAMHRRAK